MLEHNQTTVNYHLTLPNTPYLIELMVDHDIIERLPGTI